MTPKEKAQDLYHKFFMVIPNNEMSLDDLASKECALIAVNELIESFNSIYDASIENIEKYSGAKYGMKDYWEEVKQEIEAL
jgi:predicted nuclease with TOPRIM domain